MTWIFWVTTTDVFSMSRFFQIKFVLLATIQIFMTLTEIFIFRFLTRWVFRILGICWITWITWFTLLLLTSYKISVFPFEFLFIIRTNFFISLGAWSIRTWNMIFSLINFFFILTHFMTFFIRIFVWIQMNFFLTFISTISKMIFTSKTISTYYLKY